MDNDSQLRPKLVLFFFILQAILNCLYTMWVKSLVFVINSSWFVILPLFLYFYLAFAIIASIGLYYRKNLGLMLAYCVLMFGNVVAVVSYSFIYKKQFTIEMLIIPLIAVNLCVIFYMAFSHSYYKDD